MLEALEMWFLARDAKNKKINKLKINWTESKTNEDILKTINEKLTLIDNLN